VGRATTKHSIAKEAQREAKFTTEVTTQRNTTKTLFSREYTRINTNKKIENVPFQLLLLSLISFSFLFYFDLHSC
jgi:hypothetical protein